MSFSCFILDFFFFKKTDSNVTISAIRRIGYRFRDKYNRIESL